MRPASAGVVSPVFVGRDAEMAVARELIARAVRGDSGLLLVAGEAGVGKTRLVDEAAQHAGELGMQVLVGHCVQLGTEGLPFAPVVEALRELIRATGREQLDEVLGPARDFVARLIPSLNDGPSAAAPLSSSQLLELVLGLIERLSANKPLLLIIEDLHWADRSTLELASFLAQNLRGVPAAMLITYRSDEVDRRHPLRVLLSAWERTRAITRLELSRFDRDEVRAQLAAILDEDPDPQTLELVYERSEGNAFLAEEMLSVVRAGNPRGLSPSLRDVLLARVDLLSEPAEEVLRLAAVAGRSVPERLLVAVSDLDELAVLSAIREAVDAHLLVVDEADNGYTFRHTLARDAVYDDLLPGERVRLHTAYAEALSRDPKLLSDTHLSVVSSLAYHSYAALDLRRALEASIAAGRESVEGLAPREALTHYERALLIWPRVPAEQRPKDLDQAEVLWLAGEAGYYGGDVDRARSLVGQAITELPPDATPERRARFMASYARTTRDLGRAREGIELLEQALALLPEEPVTVVRAKVLAALSNGLLREGDLAAGTHYGELAVAAAREIGAAEVEADALITLGSIRTPSNGDDEGTDDVRAGIELATATNNSPIAMRGYVNYSDLLESLGRSQEAAVAAEAGIALAERAGALRTFGTYLTGNLAESLMHLGEWERTRALIDDTLRGQPEGIFEATAQIIRAELAMLAGDAEVARTAMLRTQALVPDQDDDQFAHPLATIAAELSRAARDFEAARSIALAAIRPGANHLAVRYQWPLVWTGVRADVERSLADPRRGAVHPALLDKVTTLEARRLPERAYRETAAAELTRLSGAPNWQPAIALWRELSWPWSLAYCLLREAEARAEAGRREAAERALVEAGEIARRLGAKPLLTEIEQLAQRARIELGDRPAAPVPSGRDPLAELGLTAREQEVLLLLAAGRSNPEIAQELFISPKTASVHVSNILTKLGLSSRVQAAGLVHRLGLAS